MVDYIANHQFEFWLALGFVLLAIEVFLGFTSGIFLFAGLGALAAGTLMAVGILPETWIAGVAGTGISSGVITALLWRPLKKLQGEQPAEKDNSSDFVGHEFVVDSDISLTQPGSTLYSGLTWKVEIDRNTGLEAISAGQLVSVTSVEVGLFKVKPSA
ncbi:NfeD family protein [Aestuariirhabdus sp. LZHN29]|uniref:NfeD family protein n=1 Tax=Aestuariirhabdus sp. LZHN29 TaxID=3417462 RepID=UPI003CF8A8DC